MSIEKSDPRLTAYVLNELGEHERAAFESELGASESDLARHELREIEHTLLALRSEFTDAEPVKLEPHRRREVEAAASAKRPEGRTRRGGGGRRRVFGALSLGAVAASVLLLTMTQAREDETGAPALPPVDSKEKRFASAPPHAVVSAPPASTSPREEAGGLALHASAPMTAPPAGHSPPPRPKYWKTDPGFSGPSSPSDPLAVSPDQRPPVRAQRLQDHSPSAQAFSTGVKAGEWDDNANYREFLRWIASGPAQAAHFIDLRDRRFIVVRDAAGLGVPSCRVVIEDDAERRTELVTAATGRAILFPHAEGLMGQTFTAWTSCGGGAQARFNIAQDEGVVTLRLANRRTLGERTIDVAFVLDSTGSMNEEIAAVKSTIQKVTNSLGDTNVRVRVGLVEYKDRGDAYVTKVFPMSNDLAQFSMQVAALSASGGGDTPESVNEALHVAVEQLSWSDEAFAKLAFLVGDAPPHLDYPQDYDYVLEAREAAHRGIQLFTVAASGMDTLGQVVWRQVAAYTGATNLFVLRGGAGPQSTGAGDPKSSCGGTQTAYTTGNLDALLLAKIHAAVRALDRDPTRIPGLNADENAKPCANRIAQ